MYCMQSAPQPLDHRIISLCYNHSAGPLDRQLIHHGRAGNVAEVRLALLLLCLADAVETALESDVRNVRPLQHHADDPAHMTVPNDNDVIMDRLTQRLERQDGI